MPRLLALCLALAFAAGSAAADEAVASSASVAPAATEPVAEYRAANPFVEHAPLAFFSIGSLAVGAAFYGIQHGAGDDAAFAVSGQRSQMDMAIAASGLTALAAGITYFYYAHRDAKRAKEWEETASAVSGGISPDGTARLAVKLPLPSYLDL